MPDCNKLRNLIIEKSEILTDSLNIELRDLIINECVHLYFDIWTNNHNRQSYINFVIFLLDPNSNRIRRIILGCDTI